MSLISPTHVEIVVDIFPNLVVNEFSIVWHFPWKITCHPVLCVCTNVSNNSSLSLQDRTKPFLVQKSEFYSTAASWRHSHTLQFNLKLLAKKYIYIVYIYIYIILSKVLYKIISSLFVYYPLSLTST